MAVFFTLPAYMAVSARFMPSSSPEASAEESSASMASSYQPTISTRVPRSTIRAAISLRRRLLWRFAEAALAALTSVRK